jgi:hypothetical protein
MAPRGKIVAVMQPYFLPFPGYFRLFAAADEVVLLDTVQFPRHGFVHRNRFRKLTGVLGWLPLPIGFGRHGTLIRDLVFAPGAAATLRDRSRAFEMFSREGAADSRIIAELSAVDGAPLEVIIRLLSICCAELDLPFSDLRASNLGIAADLTGQDRVLAIAEALGATAYVNLPGGRPLYDAEAFAARGMDLRFLSPYEGPLDSIGQRLHDHPPQVVRDEILGQCALEPA